MTRAEIIAALQAALDSRESALIVWEKVKPAVREAIEELSVVNFLKTPVEETLVIYSPPQFDTKEFDDALRPECTSPEEYVWKRYPGHIDTLAGYLLTQMRPTYFMLSDEKP